MQERGSSVNSASEQKVDLFKARLPPEEADSYFKQVTETLASARENPHKNFLEKLRGHLAKDHLDHLVQSYGVLLPLTLQECVQKRQASEATPENVQELLMEVSIFLSRFKNTGVELIGTPPPHLPSTR